MLRALLEAAEGSSAAVVHELSLGAWTARVVVDGAVVRSVSAGPFSGEDALFRLLLSPRRAVRTQTGVAVARPSPDTWAVAGEVGAAAALVERFDAWSRDLEKSAARVGGFSRRWAVRYLALKTVLAGLPEEVKRVVRLLDGTRDLRTLLAESPLSTPLTLRVVERLLQQGTLERADLNGDDDDSNDAGSAPSVVDDVAAVEAAGADRSWLDQRATAPPAPAPAVVSEEPPLMLEAKKKPPEPAAPEPATVAGTSTLPTALPSPKKPELSKWLGPEDEFFDSHAPAAAKLEPTTSWPPWTLAALVLVGALVGALVARACIG